MSGFDQSTYLSVCMELVGIEMVGNENVFVAKRCLCLPLLHLLRPVFGRYRELFLFIKIISIPTVSILH